MQFAVFITPMATISLIEPQPLVDRAADIDDQASFEWHSSAIYTVNAPLDCGPITVHFE